MTARRVKKARKASLCPWCSGPVFVGMQICLVGREWVRTSCVLKAAGYEPWSLAPTGRAS